MTDSEWSDNIMRGFARKSVWSILFTFLTVIVVSAQLSDCAALLEDALFAVEGNCEETGRNEACYGYNQVSASFINDVSEDFFTIPSDRSAVADLETIRTAALDLETDTWGVALMNIQANLPDTLPGQSVTFILLGDVEVENGVDPETAFQPSEGIEITVNAPAGANIRSGAGTNFNVIGGAGYEATLMTDGVSEDGDWFRVAYNERVGWVNRIVFDDTVDGLAELPVLTDDLQTPMQAFYLRTGIGQPECEEAPDNLLMVQGPENIEVSINANGADITIGSTLGLRTIIFNGLPYLEAIAFAGEIDFMGVRLRPGQRSRACLGDENSRGLDGEGNDLIVTCDPTAPEWIPDFGADWCIMEQIPASLLHYWINIPCPGDAPAGGGGGGGGGNASESNVPGIDCSTLQLISPLTPVNSGNQTFSWTPVAGEGILYQLVFFNYLDQEVESFFTPETSKTVNLGLETSTGGEFTWVIRIFIDNGQTYVCVSGPSPRIIRTGELTPGGGGEGAAFTAFRGECRDMRTGFEVDVNWSNAPSTPVSVAWTDVQGVTGTASSGAASGGLTISRPAGLRVISIVVSAGGESINVGGCPR